MDTAPEISTRTRRAGFPTPRPPEDLRAHPLELVVVGVDGSASSVSALVWAMKHALQQRCGLLVLTAWPLGRRPFVREAPGHFNEARWEAREAQARSIAHARSIVDAVPEVETALANASALDALVAAAGLGNLVVLGTDCREDGGGRPLRTPSLTVQVQQNAPCPVILVPAPAPQPDTPQSP